MNSSLNNKRMLYSPKETQENQANPAEVDPFLEAVDSADCAYSLPKAGDVIGPYRLIRRIADGGMSVVYMAERIDGHFRKRVALKVLTSEFSNEEMLTRFRGERQILAQFNHPNIAALLDGGETKSGQPYVVMEYISGSSFVEYIQSQNLELHARVRLFLKVCAAVDYSHQHLIVHRDIKPDNILVNVQGIPKLLDFGIAKLLRPDFVQMQMAKTQLGEKLLTPLYASPEQIQGGPIGTTSDVYSLGVLLFEVLTGTMPYPEPWHGLNLVKAICTEEPLQASVAASDPEVQSRLQGDLDHIVQKTLQKDPQRRYGSVLLLMQDLERYLSGFPVLAQPDSLPYRLEKYVRRNKIAAVAAATVACVVIFSGLTLFRVATEARKERDTAVQVAEFMADVFHGADDRTETGEPISALVLLDRGAARVDKELAGQPELQGRLMDMMGRSYRDSGNPEKALQLFNRSLELRRQVFGNDSWPVAETLQSLTQLHSMTGNYQDGEKTGQECLRIMQLLKGDEDAEVANTKNILGLILAYEGKHSQAGPMMESALVTSKKLLGETHIYTTSLMNNLTIVWRAQGRLDEMEAVLRKLLAIERQQHGDWSPRTARALTNLGQILVERGGAVEATPYLEEGLKIRRKQFPDKESPHLAISLSSMAQCLQNQGKLELAEQLWQEVIPMRLKLLGPKNIFVTSDQINFGEWNRLKGNLDKAAELGQQSLAIRKETLLPEDPLFVQNYALLGRVAQDQGRFQVAEEWFRKAFDSRTKLHGASNPRTTVDSMINLGQALVHNGKVEEGHQLLARAVEIRRAKLAPDDPQRMAAENAIAPNLPSR